MTADSTTKFPNLSIVALVVSNLVPLLGVLFFGWSVFQVMFIYWAENVVVGIWNVVKMLTAKRSQEDSFGAIMFVVCFFIFHYGLFCTAHGFFVFFMFGSSFSKFEFQPLTQPVTAGMLLGAAALFISHGVSYFQNYIGKGEYKKPGDLLGAPYGRMMLLHVAIVIGGGAVLVLGLPVLALALLVVMKIVFDIRAHRKAHRKLAQIKQRKSV